MESDSRTAVATGAVPWLVAIHAAAIELSPMSYFCGGIAVSDRWVVTTAACVQGADSNALEIVTNSEGFDTPRVPVSVAQVVVHPAALMSHAGNDSGPDNDIALLRLTEPIDGPFADLMTLDSENDFVRDGVVGLVVGRGSTALEDSPSYALRELPFLVMSQVACNGPAIYAGSITANMLCAGSIEQGLDACAGFAGSPLLVVDYVGSYKVAGLVSWGKRCGTFPTVFTRVSRYETWVSDEIVK